jgi:alginate O-acetyltransferase complex protein AlgI
VLIANNMAIIADYAFSTSGENSVLLAWLGAAAYTFQIYFDFGGYSDMAIGLGLMFGFHFRENFDYPYISMSITEFWRRWHISLGSWFRDYLYIPLGGNRTKSHARHIFNIFMVWLCTGIWHGANWTFIVWGLFHGVVQVIEKYVLKDLLAKIPRIIRIVFTQLLVLIGWVFFFSPSLGSAFLWLGKMLGIGAAGALDATAKYYLGSSAIILIIGALAAYPLGATFGTRMLKGKNQTPVYLSVAWFAVLLILCIAGMMSSTYSSFLYFQF